MSKKIKFNVRSPEGLACLAFAGLMAFDQLSSNDVEAPVNTSNPTFLSVPSQESRPLRQNLLNEFPAYKSQLLRYGIQPDVPFRSLLVSRDDKPSAYVDKYVLDCTELPSDWSERLKHSFGKASISTLATETIFFVTTHGEPTGMSISQKFTCI